MLTQLGLEAGRYILYVSRLEPENNAHVVMEAYAEADLDLPLVVVGDAPYAAEYKHHLQELAERIPGIHLTGFVFGDGYAELQSNATVYVQATEVGGTHPALVEAMGRGAAIIANDVPEHREVLGEAGLYYLRNDVRHLAMTLRTLVAAPAQREALGRSAAERAQRLYSWEHVTDLYERLFERMVGTMKLSGAESVD
jgi:glycosyltransferase involved in cell wall biosynthesis